MPPAPHGLTMRAPGRSRSCAPSSAGRATSTRPRVASRAATMRDELATVLRLVAEGKLSPDEAAPLIEALSHAPGGSTRSGLQPDRPLERGPQPPPPPPPVGRSDPRQVR